MSFLCPLYDLFVDFQRYTEFGMRRNLNRAGLSIVSLETAGHAIRAVGLLTSLAVSGLVHERRDSIFAVLLLPLAMILVATINITAFILSPFWRGWCHIATGCRVEAIKP